MGYFCKIQFGVTFNQRLILDSIESMLPRTSFSVTNRQLVTLPRSC